MRSFYLHGYLRISGLRCVFNLFFLPNNFKEKNENYAISLSVCGDYFSCVRDNSGFCSRSGKTSSIPFFWRVSNYHCFFLSFFFFLIDKNCGQGGECSAGQYHWGSLYPRVLRHDGILGGERTDGESCGTDRMVTHRVGVHE